MNEAVYHLHAEFEESHWWFRARRRIITDVVRLLLCGEGTVVDVGALRDGCWGDWRQISGALVWTRLPRPSRSPGPDGQGSRFGRRVSRLASSGLAGGLASSLLLDVVEHVEDDTSLFSATLESMGDGDHLVLTLPADMGLWSQHDQSYGHFRR